MKPVVVITGASRGLGKTLYDYLIKDGKYTVIGTSREPSVQSGLYSLDVTDFESIESFKNRVLEDHSQVDILINNAGVNLIGSCIGTSFEEHKLVMDVNFEGAVAMTRAFLPSMMEKEVGKLIHITSVGDSVALPFNSSYAASKFALAAYVESLTYELKGTGITTCLVEPIALRLSEQKKSLKYVENEYLGYQRLSHKLHYRMSHNVSPSIKPIVVVKRIVSLFDRKRLPLHYIIGGPGYMIVMMHKILPYRLFAWILGLWYN